jgi:hypothetical protein
MIAPASDTDRRPYELVVFDTREPGITEHLSSQRAAWRKSATVESLDPDHAALIVRAGGAVQRDQRRRT